MQALKEAMNVTKSIDLISKEKQKNWFFKVIVNLDENIINYQSWTNAFAVEFDKKQVYFDSENYQRENLQKVYYMLNILFNEDQTIFRMSRIILSQSLKF